MLRTSLPLMLALLAGCSKGPEADLEYIKQARSVAAEWALINEQAAQGKLTATYTASMHEWLRDQLQTTSVSLSDPQSDYGKEIGALLRQPNNAVPQQLRNHAEMLKQIEDSLESA